MKTPDQPPKISTVPAGIPAVETGDGNARESAETPRPVGLDGGPDTAGGAGKVLEFPTKFPSRGAGVSAGNFRHGNGGNGGNAGMESTNIVALAMKLSRVGAGPLTDRELVIAARVFAADLALAFGETWDRICVARRAEDWETLLRAVHGQTLGTPYAFDALEIVAAEIERRAGEPQKPAG